MKKERKPGLCRLSGTAILLSALLSVFSAAAFCAVDMLAYLVSGGTAFVHPLWSLAMIPLTAAAALSAAAVAGQRQSRRISDLRDGIRKVTEGESGVRLPADSAGPFIEAYEGFNAMARELEKERSMQSGALDDFSHELKTPISSILGCARMLRDEATDASAREKYLSMIERDAARMNSLLQNTLFLSRLDMKTLVTDRQEYNLTEQLRDCVILMQDSWESKGLDMSADLPEGVLFCGNMPLMERVWTNLLSNAIKFTPSGGSVSVTMDLTDTEIRVAITDSGIGIPAADLPHIFERFYQSDHTPQSSGHGLGLVIVKQSLSLSGGTVTAESGEGRGSRFTVTLPRTLPQNP